MRFIPTPIPDVIVIEPKVFTDERGFFLESYREERFAAAGISARFVRITIRPPYRAFCADCIIR